MATSNKPSVSISDFRELLNSKDLQGILDTGRRLFEHPMLLVDRDCKIIAATNEADPGEIGWGRLASSGRVAFSGAFDPQTTESAQIAALSDASVHCPDDGDISVHQRALVIDGKIAGYLLSPGDPDSFTDDEIALFEIIGNLCSLYMGAQRGCGESPKNHLESFINDLLAGNITDPYLIRESMDHFRWNIKGSMQILSVRNISEGSERTVRSALHGFEECFPHMTLFFHGPSAKVVLLTEEKAADMDSRLLKFKSLLEKEDLHAGLSRAFTNIREFAECNGEAEKALELGSRLDPSARIYHYDDYAVYHMFETCQPHIKTMKFCHSSIIKLAEYDRQHSGELVDTLKYYLFRNRNISEAASHVHIHRNTMNYRIGKISELLDLDLEDAKTSFELMLSFYILDYYAATVMRGSSEKLE